MELSKGNWSTKLSENRYNNDSDHPVDLIRDTALRFCVAFLDAIELLFRTVKTDEDVIQKDTQERTITITGAADETEE